MIKNNYYLSGTTAIGSTVTDLDTTGYTTAFNSGDVTGSLRDTLNGNLATVEEIIAGHLGYLQSSQWANLIAELNGQNVRAMKWHIENGHPVPSNCSFAGGICSCGAVQYIERSWNGSSVVSTSKSADATAVNSTGSGVTWSNGWYKVTGNVTIDDRATINGTVNLILCDGATLTVNDGIVVNSGKTLNIYGQSAGTGKLVSTGYDYIAGIGGYKSAAGTITIHGGNITATGCTTYNVEGNYSSAGIGGGGKHNGGGTVSIYGGTVTATGDTYAGRNTTDFDMVVGGVYTFGADGKLCKREGIVDLRYYENYRLMLGNGLTKVGENFIYVNSNGELIVNSEYYVLSNNLGIASGMYDFDENGFMIEPVSTDKDGIYFENDAWYYYKSGKKQYGLGLVKLEDGSYIYVRTNGELAVGSCWITNHNDLLPEGTYEFGTDGILTIN